MLGISQKLEPYRRLLKLAKRPGRSELSLSIKICFIGVVVIGAIGFLIHIAGTYLWEAVYGGL